MGQEEVLKVLKKVKIPLTSNEIAELIDIGSRSVRRILKDLKKDSTINLKVVKLSMEDIIEKYGKEIRSPRVCAYILEGV